MASSIAMALGGGLLELGEQWINTQQTQRSFMLQAIMAEMEDARKRALEEVKANREQKKYERERKDKLADYERERADSLIDTGIEHGLEKELIDYRAANKAPGKTTLQKVRQGDEEVAYLFNPDGTHSEFARGPAFKQEMPTKAQYILDRLGQLQQNYARKLKPEEAEELRESLGNEYDILTEGLLASPPPAASPPPPASAPPPAASQPAGEDPRIAAIPEPAKAMLRSDPSPDAQREFDQVFGAGMAALVLGQ